MDVLTKINGLFLEDGMLLATTDIEYLYTSIKHADGLRAARFFLETTNWDGHLIDLILDLLEFVLTHNYFVFKDRFYLQTQGTAMGTACAPSYASLFVGHWERWLLHGDRAQVADPVVGWFRYIDDVLLIWNGDDTSLSKFMQQLNINPFNLKFTYNWHPNKIDFLDISLCVGEDGAIETGLYRKETSVNSLLHASSAHNYSTIKAIPVGQFLRNRRVCSTEERFEKQSVALTDRFCTRGYSHRCIKAGYRRAKNTRREDLLVQPKKCKQTDEPMVRFISTSNCHWDRIHGEFSPLTLWEITLHMFSQVFTAYRPGDSFAHPTQPKESPPLKVAKWTAMSKSEGKQ
ncbi:unnamed protein product [Ranitomeya imitator]|uniref:Reverse transcriptase domain-containing protein n=1 Tax=Ranitomeya imitator TaxID=111125 RepID=A0ABN9KQW5_9NEOB|nr:unnamed protein product [Ranitomeya imitator]